MHHATTPPRHHDPLKLSWQANAWTAVVREQRIESRRWLPAKAAGAAAP